MGSRLDQHHYAIFDVETTGFDPDDGDAIVEIAVTRMEPDGTRLAEFSSLVHPGRDVGPTDIHRITDTMVAAAPTFPQIQGHVCDLMHNAVVVAHNAAFDRRFLAAALAGGGVDVTQMPVLCTVRLTDQLLLDRVADRKLATLAERFALPLDGAHAAHVDVRATASLLAGYLHIAQERGHDLADLRRSFVGGFGDADLDLDVSGTCDPVNRDGIELLLASDYPNVPDRDLLAPFHPPADPAQAATWQATFDRYRDKVTCPKCGDGLLRERARRRDGRPFRACGNWEADGSGCNYTAQVTGTAA